MLESDKNREGSESVEFPLSSEGEVPYSLQPFGVAMEKRQDAPIRRIIG